MAVGEPDGADDPPVDLDEYPGHTGFGLGAPGQLQAPAL